MLSKKGHLSTTVQRDDDPTPKKVARAATQGHFSERENVDGSYTFTRGASRLEGSFLDMGAPRLPLCLREVPWRQSLFLVLMYQKASARYLRCMPRLAGPVPPRGTPLREGLVLAEASCPRQIGRAHV